jgi:hypothetical protein
MRSARARSASLAQRGTSLVEVMFVVSLFTVVLLASLAMIESGRRFSSSTIHISTVEDLAQQMLFRMERELANASGTEPRAVVNVPFVQGETAALVAATSNGFPPHGRLILERGTASEERVAYEDLAADEMTFLTLTRGVECTSDVAHLPTQATTVELMWEGLAEVIPNQTNPAPSEFDGIADEDGSPVFFQGDGTGFSYRVPVDPTGGTDYLNGNDLFWGVEIPGFGATTDGWAALYFEPKTVYDEADRAEDINGDGDTVDVFDVGQIRRVLWDRTNPATRKDTGLGPSAVIQERCNRGGDLDNDGFDDPIFLWDKDTNQLHVRLFLLGQGIADMPIVRQVESLMFLRNEPEL